MNPKIDPEILFKIAFLVTVLRALVKIVVPNCPEPENLLSVLQGQRDQNVVSGRFIAVASHTIWRWNISSKLTDSMTQIQSQADTLSPCIMQFPLMRNLAYVGISRGILH